MPRSIVQTYPYLGGLAILITVTALGLYSRLQVEAAADRRAAMEMKTTLDKLRSVWHRLMQPFRPGRPGS